MTPETFRTVALDPAFALLPSEMDNLTVRFMLFAIAMQESGLVHRRQVRGPARSYYQFEKIGVAEVLRHPASRKHAVNLCTALDVEPDAAVVYKVMEYNDPLATGIARLALWRDKKPQPRTREEMWALYLRVWRPGKPGPDRWEMSYDTASTAFSIEA